MSAAFEAPAINYTSVRGTKTYDQHGWTDAMVVRLRALWAEGHSTAEIGRRLGLTKNAIVGKARRLDLPARPSPIVRNGEPRPPATPRAARVTLPPLASVSAPPLPIAPTLSRSPPRFIVVKPPIINFARPEGPRPVNPPTAAPRVLGGQCRMPLWRTGARPSHKYCDAPTPLGDSWCSKCRKKVFTRIGATAGFDRSKGPQNDQMPPR